MLIELATRIFSVVQGSDMVTHRDGISSAHINWWECRSGGTKTNLTSCPQAPTMSILCVCNDFLQLSLRTLKLGVRTLQPPLHFSLQPNHTPPTL